MLFLIAAIVVSISVFGWTLWLGARMTGVDTTLPAMILCAAIASAVAWIPLVGGILSFVVLLGLIAKVTGMRVWPDAILIVVVAWGLRWLAILGLVGMLS